MIRTPKDLNSEEGRDYSIFDAELSGQVLNMRLLGRLFGWLRPYRPTVFLGAVLVLMSATMAVLMPVVVSLVAIDTILMKRVGREMPDFGMNALTRYLGEWLILDPLLAACLLYMVLVIGWTTLGHFARMSFAGSITKALRDLRYDLFTHLEHLPASFYDRVAVGRVMTRVTNDVEILFQLLAGFGMLLAEFVPFFVALVIMFRNNPKLEGTILLAVPIAGVVTYLFRQATRRIYRAIRNTVSGLNQNLQENLVGIQVVQLHNREALNLKKYTGINRLNRRNENQAIEIETLYGQFIDSLASGALAAIVWFGGGDVIRGTFSLGGLVLFSQFVDMLFRPIVRLGEQYNVLFRAMASGERIFQTLDWDERIHQPKSPEKLPERLKGSIEFRDLTFGYQKNLPVLHRVSFSINPGEKMAIVGPTGSGKSTLIRLLGRFYDFDEERIFLDGIDLRRIHTRDLRQRIGVVLQDFHIFSGTIRENIILGNPRISPQRAEEAARMVNADPFIRNMPMGYETPLAERGQNLSQGQRQLLAFARVLAADPEILILDEATASIDTETELIIQDALRKLTAGRTSILIAHRLQTIEEADRILVLQNGRVKEIGSHDELIALQGVYRTLWELQFQNGSENDGSL
ncbi:MAG: ABC transporter ATP-binding protein [Proteobacteria bacterium]|nr:ABC transporter ATP-binding protein [Pseudomonadota bacterium]